MLPIENEREPACPRVRWDPGPGTYRHGHANLAEEQLGLAVGKATALVHIRKQVTARRPVHDPGTAASRGQLGTSAQPPVTDTCVTPARHCRNAQL